MFILDDVSWSFDMTNFGSVWFLVLEIALLLLFLLIGNTIRRVVPFLRKAFIPSSLIGGLLLLIVKIIFDKALNIQIINDRHMQIITYHMLAIGFIAMTLKTNKNKKEGLGLKSIQNGLLTGATYMLQAVLGIGVSLIFFWLGFESFYDAGIILPLGYGQGPGNALTWDINFTTMGLFEGNGSFGLSIASIGFLVASIVGVIFIGIQRKRNQIVNRYENRERTLEIFEEENEIDDADSVDKTSIQLSFVAISYVLAFGFMFLLKLLSDVTNVALFNSVAWGFNFIFGVISATLVKVIINLLHKKNITKKKYINNYQMDRISGFAFDLMIVAGVVAIDINIVSKYVVLIIVLTLIGAIATFFYVYFISKLCFKDYYNEAFLLNFGTLTGTASNGMILLREVDPNYETDAANVYIISQFPAMLFVAPILLLLNFSGKSLTNCLIALGIFFLLLLVYTTILILTGKGIIGKKKIKE